MITDRKICNSRNGDTSAM